QLPKLSPLTWVLLKQIEGLDVHTANVPEGYIYRHINGKPYLGGIIKVSGAQVGDKLNSMGVLVGTRAGDIWTVQVPFSKIREFTATAGISYIQLDEPLKPAMNVARKTTRVDSVHMGVGLPWPMTGLGVVVGVIDFGFDYNHPAFFDAAGTSYRVKKA